MRDLETLLHEAGDVTPADTDYADVRRRGTRRRQVRRGAAGAVVATGLIAVVAVGASTLRPGVTIDPVGAGVDAEVGETVGPWTRLPDPPGPIRDGASLVSDGSVAVLLGGREASLTGDGPRIGSVALLELDERSWRQLPPIDVAGSPFGASARDFAAGRLLAEVGGDYLVLDVNGGPSWEPLTLPDGVIDPIVVSMDAERLVLDVLGDDLDETEERRRFAIRAWDSDWLVVDAAPGSDNGGVVVDGDRLYTVGGATGEPGDEEVTDAVRVLDLTTGRWSDLPPLPLAPRSGPSLTVDERGRLVVAGGRGPAPAAAPRGPDPEPSTSESCDGDTCTFSMSGSASGAPQPQGVPLDDAARFDPTTGTWEVLDLEAMERRIATDAPGASLSSMSVADTGHVLWWSDERLLVVDTDSGDVTASVPLDPADSSTYPELVGPDALFLPQGWRVIDELGEPQEVVLESGDGRARVDVPWSRGQPTTTIVGTETLLVYGGSTWVQRVFTGPDGPRLGWNPGEYHGDLWLLDLDELR